MTGAPDGCVTPLDDTSLAIADDVFRCDCLWLGRIRTSDISVIAYCREMFQFDMPSAILKKRAEKFDSVSLN